MRSSLGRWLVPETSAQSASAQSVTLVFERNHRRRGSSKICLSSHCMPKTSGTKPHAPVMAIGIGRDSNFSRRDLFQVNVEKLRKYASRWTADWATTPARREACLQHRATNRLRNRPRGRGAAHAMDGNEDEVHVDQDWHVLRKRRRNCASKPRMLHA